MNSPRTLLLACAAALVLSVSTGLQAAEPKNIVETAQAAGQFGTLLKAAQAAGLADALSGEGPLTVFAPTDAAFEKLPDGTLESLLKPENKAQLAAILKYHVLARELSGQEAASTPLADTLEGSSVLISTDGHGGVKVDDANVVKADIKASNGVVHVIDKVILPKDIVQTAQLAGQFKTLLAAADAAGLVEALKGGDGELTLFAPTDEAFAALPAGTVEDLLKPENRQRLQAILKYHVLPRRITVTSYSAETLQGDTLEIRPIGGVQINEATIALADVKCTNGVVHVIDRVLLPELPEPTPSREAMAVIEVAIERGVPLFNNGSPEACAAVYEVAARSLMTGHRDAIGQAGRDRLAKALEAIRTNHSHRRQAWILRHALDDVYSRLRTMQ